MTFVTKIGISRTPAQVEAVFACCRQLQFAYATASQENSGSGSLRWQDVDDPSGWAADALSPGEARTIAQSASGANSSD